MGKYKKERGFFTKPGKLILEGETATGSYHQEIDFDEVEASNDNKGLAQLWARQQIRDLADYNNLRTQPELVERITHLGLDYHLMTAYTSFVAIDSESRTTTAGQTVKQPLALPEGVSNLAVGTAAAPGYSRSGSIKRKAVKVRRGNLAEDSGHIAPRAMTGKVKLRTLKVEGVAKGAWARQGLEKQLRILNNHYNRLLKLRGQNEGRIELLITLNEEGEVTHVKIIKDTLNQSRFQHRLKRVMQQARFKLPKHQGAVKVRVQLSFKAVY